VIAGGTLACPWSTRESPSPRRRWACAEPGWGASPWKTIRCASAPRHADPARPWPTWPLLSRRRSTSAAGPSATWDTNRRQPVRCRPRRRSGCGASGAGRPRSSSPAARTAGNAVVRLFLRASDDSTGGPTSWWSSSAYRGRPGKTAFLKHGRCHSNTARRGHRCGCSGQERRRHQRRPRRAQTPSGPNPIRARAAETALVGSKGMQRPSRPQPAPRCRSASRSPIRSASEWYRRKMTGVFV